MRAARRRHSAGAITTGIGVPSRRGDGPRRPARRRRRRADYLFIENVGNLVCPAIYDLGQDANVVALSVTEGEDKPLKYPVMFRKADLVLLTKIDLLPALPDFDRAALEEALARVMPAPRLIAVSARSGAGMDEWIEWIERLTRCAAGSRQRHAVAGDVTRRLCLGGDSCLSIEVNAHSSRRPSATTSCAAASAAGSFSSSAPSSWSSRPPGLALTDKVRAAEVARDIAKARRPSVIWLHFQDCTGCTETLLRTSKPDLAELILHLISLDYHETLMAAAGKQAEAALQSAMEENAGKYVLVVEGAIPHQGRRHLPEDRRQAGAARFCEDVGSQAAAIIAIGSCASWGGIPSARAEPDRAPSASTPSSRTSRSSTSRAARPNPYNLLGTVLQYARHRHAAGARRAEAAEVRLRPLHPRSLSAAGALRRRRVRALLRRRRASPRLVSVPPRLQGPGDARAVLDAALQRSRRLLADRHRRALLRLHRAGRSPSACRCSRPSSRTTWRRRTPTRPIYTQQGHVSAVAAGVAGLVGGALVGGGLALAQARTNQRRRRRSPRTSGRLRRSEPWASPDARP